MTTEQTMVNYLLLMGYRIALDYSHNRYKMAFYMHILML